MNAQTGVPRPDRLVPLPACNEACRVDFRLAEEESWATATVYLGDSVDDWRGQEVNEWNAACCGGRIPAGASVALWNPFFDVEFAVGQVSICHIRAVTADGVRLWEEMIDLSPTTDAILLDHHRFGDLDLPGDWSLHDAGHAATTGPSLYRHLQREHRYLEGSDKHYRWVVTEDPEPIVIPAGVAGWHRVYVGMEPNSSFALSFGPDAPAYEIPNAYVDSGDDDRFLQEYFVAEIDFTDQDICVRPGGSRFWRDVSIRYLKLVPMSTAEVDHHRHVREAAAGGRDFAGYLEPCTVAAYSPHFVQLRDHIRNEIQLNALRGSTDVYVHVIRIGCKSWYRSKLVEWDASDPHHAGWMRDADPAAVAVEEARAAGLRIFPDAGMNSTYVGSNAHYAAYTSEYARQHSELLCPDRPGLFDYRHKAVQEYVAAIVNELLTQYDVDGVNLDFARWGHPEAYDAPSLIQVLQRIDACRKEQERIRGRRLEISVRVPYEEAQDTDDGVAPFAAALTEWARDGLIDRFMVELQHEKLFQDKSLEHYRVALADTATRFWGDMYWGSWYYGGGPQQDLDIARRLAEHGVDGGFFYYMRGRPIEWESINWQLRLIDRPDLVVAPTPPRRILQETAIDG